MLELEEDGPDATLAKLTVTGPFMGALRRSLPALASPQGARPWLYDLCQTSWPEWLGGLSVFDLRYHVASLTAVFLALLIGIVVGVGISGSVDKGEKSLASAQRHALQDQLTTARGQVADLSQKQRAAGAFLQQTYPGAMHNRLKFKRIAAVFVGAERRASARCSTRRCATRARAGSRASGR